MSRQHMAAHRHVLELAGNLGDVSDQPESEQQHATSVVDKWTDRFSSSRFGRDVFGPRIARPVAHWLTENFVDPDTAIDPDSATDPDTRIADRQPVVETAVPSIAEPVAKFAEVDTLDLRPNSPQALFNTLKALGERVKVHNLVVVAAGIAFWGLLAIPATLFAVVSIAGLLLDPDTVKEQVSENLPGLPDEAKEIITGQLEGVAGGSTGGLIAGVVFGLMLALWTSSGAMAKLMGALNTIYDTIETRKLPKLRGTALLLTFGGIVFVSGAIFLLAALPALLASIDGVGDSAATLFVWLRFPVLGLVMIIALGVLYHVGPNRSTRYRPVTLGAAAAMILWLSLSALFTIYTSTVGNYNETYGSIGGIVILLLWLFITSFVVLLGAEIHAQSELNT